MNRSRRGFTLIEAVISLLVLSLILLVVHKIIVSSQRGSMRGQEASMHLFSETVLSQRMERDFRSILPYPIHTTLGKVGGPISYSPDAANATEMLFWRLAQDGVEQVRYAYDPARKEIRREVVSLQGVPLRTSRFATGMVTACKMSDPTADAKVFRVRLTMSGKERQTETERIFSHGFSHQQFSQHWVFHFP